MASSLGKMPTTSARRLLDALNEVPELAGNGAAIAALVHSRLVDQIVMKGIFVCHNSYSPVW